MEKDFSNGFIKQVTLLLSTKLWNFLNKFKLGDQSASTCCGHHWARASHTTTLLKQPRFTFPEFTRLMLSDEVQLARCFLARLQTALGLPSKSDTAALAGRMTGSTSASPHQRPISRPVQTQTPWAQPSSQAVTVHKINRLFCLWSEHDIKKNQNKP